MVTGAIGAAAVSMSTTVASAAFVLADDFEGYTQNSTAIGSNGWIAGNSSFLTAVADPLDPSNQVGRAAGASSAVRLRGVIITPTVEFIDQVPARFRFRG
ncbi:hypothetical protein ACERK3_12710 [Phycisphaerales bacterium AB-hyl4]|uniref:Uncharacterized protein n=1 Tax=Natronomicrosphaera hydrolytica TaxID=3242702 RepID=A0ABV4U6C2_9BACT